MDERDRQAIALRHGLREVRKLSEEVLRRFRAGEELSCQVQRRLFHAAYDLEQMCRRLDETLGRKPSG